MTLDGAAALSTEKISTLLEVLVHNILIDLQYYGLQFEKFDTTMRTQNESTAALNKKNEAANDDTSTVPEIEPVIPLHAKWNFWYDNPRLAPPGSDWKENLKVQGTFDNVETFWRIYNNIVPASRLSVGSNYSVFRYGIEPSWEHPENSKGGKFVLTMNKKENKGRTLDEYWLFTVLACIGETMDASGDQICGAVVSVRKNENKMALWLKSDDKATCVDIGERWKKVLKLEKTVLRYQTHKDAAASGRSFRNEVYFEV